MAVGLKAGTYLLFDLAYASFCVHTCLYGTCGTGRYHQGADMKRKYKKRKNKKYSMLSAKMLPLAVYSDRFVCCCHGGACSYCILQAHTLLHINSGIDTIRKIHCNTTKSQQNVNHEIKIRFSHYQSRCLKKLSLPKKAL